ncbi:MAG TPA: amino acid adenylation domain-containing protein, partial [Thermoanaerobaculia bacterium]|nr:amino acid adenylation domain-containing protein [Thermoanaerobaculia bacterium]
RLVKQEAFACLGEEEVFLQAAPISFDASTLEIWGPLLNGGRLVLFEEDEMSLEGLERAIRRHGVTVLWLTAGLFHQVVEVRPEVLAGVRQLLAGGDVLLPPRVERLLRENREVRLVNGYGPTESTTFTCCHPVREAPLPGATVPIGRPIANTRVHVLDRWLEPVPAGAFGELCIGGDGLATGYLNRPALTAERFVPDPVADLPGERLYRTGDLVRRLPAGLIEFAGRIDNQVKVRGYRVEPGEVEAVLSRHAAVRDAAVVVREDRPGDKRLAAFVVAAAGARNPEEELLSYLRRTLPAYMVPSDLSWLDELPRNPNGKVDRRALLAVRVDPARPAVAEPAGPLTATQEVMSEIWAEVLGRERVGIHASFFDLGGHSLLAMQVISRVRKVFGVEILMRTLFEHDTVNALSERVDEILRAEAGVRLPPIVPARRTGPIPLSFAQQRLWFLDQLTPGGAAYNVPVAWHLAGHLRLDALAAGVTEIVRRHEALRTTFHPSADGAFQVVSPPAPVPLPVADLSGLSPADREAEAGRLVEAEAGRPFDLIRGPLLRVALLRLESERSVAMLTLHHIVSDGWSLGVLGREISALEEAFAAGRPSPLPELPVQYADFALWQREVLSEGALTAEIEYWREQLRGAPAITDLPLDRPRPLDWAYEGRSRSSRLSAELSAALRRLGRRHGATPFMTLLAAFQALLARYAGQPDISAGTPVAGRTHLEIEGLIGFFVNTLVLRTRMEDDPHFEELVQRVRGITLEAHAHQNVPFEELVEKLQPERHVGISPLVQVMFAVQNNKGWGGGLPGLEAREAHFESRTAKFDLSLGVQEDTAEIALTLEYSTRLFDGTTAVRLLASLERLLAAAAASPNLPLSALPLLWPAERQQMVREWNDTEPRSVWPGAVHEQIAAQAWRTPNALAVVQGEAGLSYGELDARAVRLARHLRSLGVEREGLVAVCFERSLEMIVGILGVLKAGGAYLPIDPAYPQERLALLLFDAPVKAVLTQEPLVNRLPWGEWPVICLDRPLPEPAGPEEEAADLPGPAWPEQAAYLIYTSGSTGRPKAVVGLHGSLANYVRAAVQEYGVTSRDRVLQFSSISFDTSAEEIFPALVTGATLVLRDEEWMASTTAFLSHCDREAITVLSQPTAYWHEMARACGEGETNPPPALRLMICGGERALPERVAQWCRTQSPRSTLMNTYGPTEATVVATGCPLSGPNWSWETVPIGRPWSGVQVHVVTGDLDLAPLGAGGELVIGGNGLTRGYLNRPETTAERFVPDPFSPIPGRRLYRTGDRVRWLPDGRLDFLGRMDQQVKVRGYRIELGEIEAALSEYPLVRDVAVIAREEVPGQPRLVAYLVPQADASPTAAELRGFLQEVLPEFMLPSAFVLLPALPLTVTGKLDRLALPVPGMDRSLSSAPFVAPRTPTEEVLAMIWAELLRVDRVGIHDNFFELGGHSLLATQIVSRVRNVLQAELPVRTVFERPTLSGLAHAVDSSRRGHGGPQVPPLTRVDRSLDLPLSFAQQRLWFIDQLEPQSTVYNMPMWLAAKGRLAVDVLVQSLREVVRRHEVLRTVFRAVDGQPFQVVSAEVRLEGPVVDLMGLTPEDRQRQTERLIEENARLPFFLDRGPLMRLRLLRLAPAEHLVLFDMHHIASDGWS